VWSSLKLIINLCSKLSILFTCKS